VTRNEKEIVQEKLLSLQGYYTELKEFEKITFADYCGNNLYRRTVERLIQLIVEAATDINNILLKSLSKGPTADYYSSFMELAEAGILPGDFAESIAPSTGLRNIIVHEYQKLDNRIVYESIQDTLKYYLKYMDIISKLNV
jgi:uncharacterized protein YutE (UPF0331/DUF86 family)